MPGAVDEELTHLCGIARPSHALGVLVLVLGYDAAVADRVQGEATVDGRGDAGFDGNIEGPVVEAHRFRPEHALDLVVGPVERGGYYTETPCAADFADRLLRQ